MTKIQSWRERALAAVIQAAMLGGAIAKRYFLNLPKIEIKADGTPVTEADKETEITIVEILRKKFPECGFLGEETGERGSKDRRWIIDPIDGTKNFIRGIPIWAVLIALEEEGEVTVGAIHNPATGDIWTAAKDLGARRNGKLISVSRRSLQDAMLLHGGIRVLKTSCYWNGFLRLADLTKHERGPGDFLGYIMVAEGQAEIFLDLELKPWDLAAPSIVVREAGGVFTDLRGRETIYGGNALAANSQKMHQAALKILNARLI